MLKMAVVGLLAVAVSTGCRGTSSSVSGSGADPTLRCRLPVISPTTPGVPPGGWITFRGGGFERDPASLPGRLNAHVPSYDRAIRAWLPVRTATGFQWVGAVRGLLGPGGSADVMDGISRKCLLQHLHAVTPFAYRI